MDVFFVMRIDWVRAHRRLKRDVTCFFVKDD